MFVLDSLVNMPPPDSWAGVSPLPQNDNRIIPTPALHIIMGRVTAFLSIDYGTRHSMCGNVLPTPLRKFYPFLPHPRHQLMPDFPSVFLISRQSFLEHVVFEGGADDEEEDDDAAGNQRPPGTQENGDS